MIEEYGMGNVVFLDTETPGFKLPLRPIEVGALACLGVPLDLHVAESCSLRFRLTGEMELGALSTHHILPQELEGLEEWNGPKFIEEWIRGQDYMVGHNIDFDWEVIGKPEGPKRICTLALSRFFYPDLDAHRLAAMMYHLFGASEETRDRLRGAHSALVDVCNCRWILGHICDQYTLRTWEEVYAASELGRMPLRMTFGKHGPKNGEKGMLIRDMVKKDPGYVKWMKSNIPDLDPYLLKALDNPR